MKESLQEIEMTRLLFCFFHHASQVFFSISQSDVTAISFLIQVEKFAPLDFAPALMILLDHSFELNEEKNSVMKEYRFGPTNGTSIDHS